MIGKLKIQPDFICLRDQKGELILSIGQDGNLALGEGVELTDVSKKFYDEVSKFIKEKNLGQ